MDDSAYGFDETTMKIENKKSGNKLFYQQIQKYLGTN